MAPAVPYTTEYWNNMVEWAGYLATWFDDNKKSNPPYGGDPALTQAYYDGQACAFKVQDHMGGSALAAWIQDEWEAYVPYYVEPAVGGVQGFRNFCEGPLEDVLRSTARSAQSKAAIQLILDNSNFVRSDNLSDDLLSRECAYALLSIICGIRANCTIDATVTARIPVLLNWCLDHINQWCVALTADYYRPFMGGITAHALTSYFTYITADSRIVPALITLANYSFSTCWKAAPGVWGQGLSFTYTDRTGFNSEDANTQPDLNMLICPLWGFLWWRTGTQSWRDQGDLIFQGGISVYEEGFYQSGSYLGTQGPSNPAGKQYDQQLIFGPKYLEWAVMDPAAGGGTPCKPLRRKRKIIQGAN